MSVGIGLVIWALPGAVRFLPDAPTAFWKLFALAMLVDAPLYRVGPPSLQRVRSSLSVCVALAIFVLWGPAPAIIVQAVAATASVFWQGFDRVRGISFVNRHVTALAVAGGLALAVVPPDTVGHAISGLAGHDLVPFAVMAGVWLVVGFGLVVLGGRPVSGYTPRQYLAAAGDDLLVVAATILLVEPLLTTVTGWWSVLIALPLFAWSLLSRVRFAHERRLNREEVTGALSRRGLEARMESLAVYDYIRPEAPAPYGIVLMNMDQLLTINRVLGRTVYEEMAREIFRRLIAVYGVGRVGRLPGEGAVVITPGLTAESGLAAAEEVVKVVEAPIKVSGIPFAGEPAAGVALSPEHGRDLEALLWRSEAAMREARRLGRLAMVYGRAETDTTSRRLAILVAMHEALCDPARSDEIAVLYQPQVELATGRLVGVEALVRWTHPELGDVPTDELIEAIEPSVVMHLLTRHVLRKAVRQVAEWNGRGRSLRVAVNASVRDLHDPAFVDELDSLIRSWGVPPTQLTIEITERMVIGADPQVTRTAERIAGLGLGLSLDDFGTGFASLDQLRTLPLTEVKIDRSYVDRLATSPGEWAIVVSVHSMAQSLRLAVVAEGVEDSSTAQTLTQLPGVLGQGWYFGRPMTAASVEQWRLPDE
jgi:predicted signal transduction protein with EAL and GGDEF domain